MNIAQPIKKLSDLEKFKVYYREVKPNLRNELLIIVGLNTALRISDLLMLRWENVYDFEKGVYRTHINIVEQKTGKKSQVYMNENILEALQEYEAEIMIKRGGIRPELFLFCHTNKNMPITRVQALRLVRSAAEGCEIAGVISCHSLRKTFGYHAWKQGAEPVLLVNIYNHSTYQVTKRYLGIDQDDRDQVFKSIRL